MLSSTEVTTAQPAAGADPNSHILRAVDILAQLILICLAWTTLSFDDSEGETRRSMLLRLPLIVWQMMSLLISAIAYESDPKRRFHNMAIWPVLASLIIGTVLYPFGVGGFLLWLWFQAASILSIPYFIITIATFFRQLIPVRIVRSPMSIRSLFRIRQADLIAQSLCLAVPMLITLGAQRPIHEALVLAYPFLAGWQLISAAQGMFIWGDMAEWRSGLRIPQMFIQAVFGIAILIRLWSDQPFQWRNTLYEPCAQILVGAYLLITYLELENLSAAAARQRRYERSPQPT